MFSYQGKAMSLSEHGLEGILEGHDLASQFNQGYKAPSSYILYHQPVVDSKGHIWIGTAKNSVDEDNFLYEFGPDGSLISSYSGFESDSRITFSEPFSDLSITPDNRLLMSSNGNGLISMDLESREFEYYPETKKGDFFWFLYDSKHTIWMNYQGDGLSRFFPSSGKITHYQTSQDDSCHISDNTFGKVFEDSRGTLWVGSFNGLNRWDSLNNCFHT